MVVTNIHSAPRTKLIIAVVKFTNFAKLCHCLSIKNQLLQDDIQMSVY
jgi:hypothetical protein